jgi:hypothetical protein
MSKEAGMGPEEGCREANKNPRDLCVQAEAWRMYCWIWRMVASHSNGL